MRIKRKTRSEETQILIGLITDRQVASVIAARWEKQGLFKSKWSNIVGEWAVDYFNSYGTPIARNIESIFEDWAESYDDEKSIELISRLLDKASNEYEQSGSINAPFVIDLADKYFNKVRLERLKESLEARLDLDDLEGAEKVASQLQQRIEMSASNGIDLFDESLIDETFEAAQQDIIKLPQGLGKFFRHTLTRDSFIAFEAPDKRGKSMWLLHIAWLALMQRKKVAFFEVGDMTRPQFMERVYTRMTRKPWFMPEDDIKIPTALDIVEGKANVTFDYRLKKDIELVTRSDVKRAIKRMKRKLKVNASQLFRLSCHPARTINVRGIRDILTSWQIQHQWVPDIILVDYADILAPPRGVQETRDQINQTWIELRALSQETHTLLMTATQSNAAAYTSDLLTEKNFSEDKRKHAHVTGFVGINCNQADKEAGVQRLNWVVRRRGKFNSYQVCTVAGSWDLYNPCTLSVF